MQKLQRMIFGYRNENTPSLEDVWVKFNEVVHYS
jgi:hypothetical protein